jgi:hypothetical protein
MIIQDVITWSSHNFLTDHLPLSANAVASLPQYDSWRQQQQQKKRLQEISSSSGSSSKQPDGLSPAAAAVAASPAGPELQISGRRAESLADHLAADETLIMADESAVRSGELGSSEVPGSDPAQVPPAHTPHPDTALEKASSSELSAAAEGVHLPVRPLEEQVYRNKVGGNAYLVKVYTQ